MAKVSVGMPVYNGAEFIAGAIQNILDQTFQDIEIVISDNGSTDETIDIIKGFSDPRIKLVQQNSNIGPLPNFAFLTETCSSEYFLWRSYDDLSDVDYISVLLKKIEQNPGCSLAAGKIVRKRLDGSISGENPYLPRYDESSIFKVRRQLLASHPGWFYGLYRREIVSRRIQDVIANYPFVWAWDHLLLFSFAIRNEITGTCETSFYPLETGKSDSSWRPKTSADQVKLLSAFLGCCRHSLEDADLTAAQKALIYLNMPIYVNGRTEKLRRVARNWIKEKLSIV